MGVRIGGDDGGGLSGIRQALENTSRANRALGSGDRINQAADDVSGSSIAENLAAQIRSLDAAQRSVQVGASLAQTAEMGLKSIQEDLQRIRELALGASNGTLGSEERKAIQGEVDQVRAEIDRTATETEFNGRRLLEGSSGGTNAVQISSGIDGETVAVDVADVRAAALGLDNVNVSSRGDAQRAISMIDAASQQMIEARAQVSAQESALQRVGNRLGTAAINEAAAESRIQGADIAAESAQRASAQIRTQFATAVQAQQNQNRGSVLRLLEG